MEPFRHAQFDFLRYRRFWVVVSIAVIGLGLVEVVLGPPLNLGIDFAGGHQATILMSRARPLDEVRRALAEAGISAQVQTLGEDGRELLVRAPLSSRAEGETAAHLIAALDRRFGVAAGTVDLNRAGAGELRSLLLGADPDQLVGKGDDPAASEHYAAVAELLLAARRQRGIFASWDQVDELVPGTETRDALRRGTTLGELAVLGQQSVGPQVGSELRQKALWAVALSLVGMLLYIWIRFELRYAIGAIMASIHDVLVTFGLYAAFGFELNLTTVAAFLTLVGYSVNDTVVVFDRMRENLRQSPRTPLDVVMNRSLNQTLSRTVLTSGTTLLAAASLLALGGDVLRGFSFVLTVGVVVGTYSSIYIASSFALLWERLALRSGRVDKPPARDAARQRGAVRRRLSNLAMGSPSRLLPVALLALACGTPPKLGPEGLERSARRAIAAWPDAPPETVDRLEAMVAELRARPDAAGSDAGWNRVTQELWLGSRQRCRHRAELGGELAELADRVGQELALAEQRSAELGGHGAAARQELARARWLANLGGRHLAAGRLEDAAEALRGAEVSCQAVDDLWRGLFSRFVRPELRRQWQEDVRYAIDSSRGGRTTLLVDKLRRRLQAYREGRLQLVLPAELGGRGLAQKLHAGDRATPEGRYRIARVKAGGETSFYKAFLLDYPNAADRLRYATARRSGRIPPGAGIGGLIEIHGDGGRGGDWTDGCVALSNADIDRLQRIVRVGTPVVIVGTHDDE